MSSACIQERTRMHTHQSKGGGKFVCACLEGAIRLFRMHAAAAASSPRRPWCRAPLVRHYTILHVATASREAVAHAPKPSLYWVT